MRLFSDYAQALKNGAKELKDYKKALENLKTAEGNNGTEAEIKARKESQDGHLKAVRARTRKGERSRGILLPLCQPTLSRSPHSVG